MVNFEAIANVLWQISVTSGNIAKETMLRHNEDLEGFKEVLNFIYNPYLKCCIGKKKLDKVSLQTNTQLASIQVLDIIEYLSTHTTGSDADVVHAAAFVSQYDSTSTMYYVAYGLVTQNLKIGVSVKTLNKVFGEHFIPVIGCMLGTLYSHVPNPYWPCIMTEKLDGIRRILIKHNGVCRMYSRSGHEDTGLVDILEDAKYLPNNMVYDGELLAIGKFANNIEHRQATAAIANSSGQKHNISLNVFDMIKYDEFTSGLSNDMAIYRKIRLGATLRDETIGFLVDNQQELITAFGIDEQLDFIKPVPILGTANTIEEVEPVLNFIWQQNGEGIMLNFINAPYEIRRSKHLMKLKFTEEMILKVIDAVEGSDSFEGTTGALIVDYKGHRVGVGSGLSMYERNAIWANKDYYIGKEVELDTFGESKNAHGGISLNCPIFKRFVGEED